MTRIRSRKALVLIVIPAKAGLRRQDAEANIGKTDGPQGEPQDAASNPLSWQERWAPTSAGATAKESFRYRRGRLG